MADLACCTVVDVGDDPGLAGPDRPELDSAIAEWVAGAFDLGSPAAAPYAARGELGYVFRLDTDAGRFAVKQLRLPPDEAGGDDAGFQLALAAAGVPLPAPILASDGEAVAVGPDGVAYRAYEWVDLDAGATVDPGAAGTILARVHRRAWPAGAPEPWYTDPGPADRWARLTERGGEAGASWAEALAGAVPALQETQAVANAGAAAPVVRCHLDYNRENVLVDTKGRPCVLDWENSGPGVPDQELAQALTEFGPSEPGSIDPAAVRALAEGYRDADGPGRLVDLTTFAMTFAVQANLLAFYAERSLTGDPADRPHSDWRVETMVDGLVTVATAAEIMALVGTG